MNKEITFNDVTEHFVFFTLLGVSFGISNFVVYNLFFLIPQIFPIGGGIILLAFPFYTYILMNIILIFLANRYSELHLKTYPRIEYQIIILILLSLQFNYVFLGNNFRFSFEYRELIDIGLFYLILLQIIFAALTVFNTSRIMYKKSERRETQVQKILDRAPLEFAVIIIIVTIILNVSASAIYQGFETFDLTSTAKLISIFLFTFLTQPEISKD